MAIERVTLGVGSDDGKITFKGNLVDEEAVRIAELKENVFSLLKDPKNVQSIGEIYANDSSSKNGEKLIGRSMKLKDKNQSIELIYYYDDYLLKIDELFPGLVPRTEMRVSELYFRTPRDSFSCAAGLLEGRIGNKEFNQIPDGNICKQYLLDGRINGALLNLRTPSKFTIGDIYEADA